MINIVYHTHLVGEWKTLVTEQLSRIISNGLYDAADEIFVTINKMENTEEEILLFFSSYPKLELIFQDMNFAEYPGIKKVREIGIQKECKIFYFHTKGVSNFWKTYNGREPSPEKIENVSLWRECLEHFLIDNWKKCVELLDEYDNVGVTNNGGWYWGNFWWTKSAHIRKTIEVELWGRWDYESWLLRNISDAKNFEFHHIGFNLYLSKLKPSFYNGDFDKYKGKKIVLLNAIYGTGFFEIDEGYCTMPIGITNDVTNQVNNLLEKESFLRLNFNINNETMGCDPIFRQRKVLLLKFHPEGFPDEVIQMGGHEGFTIDFEF